jgi:lysophospholipase L1-like esterase
MDVSCLFRRSCLLLASLLLFACQNGPDSRPLGTQPAPRSIEYDWMSVASWQEQHQHQVTEAQKGEAQWVFIGDSITAGWNGPLWASEIAPFKPINLAIGGDHTGNLLWRLEHGAAGQLNPKVVVLLIGVNNIGHLHEGPEDIFAGVSALVEQLRQTFPEARILLNGVFPFEQSADSPNRAVVQALNQRLTSLGDENKVFFRDYGHLFLEPDGSISTEIMGDFLHLTPKGYERWAHAMLPLLRQWAAEESPAHFYPASHQQLQMVGRHLREEDGSIRLGYPGVSLRFNASAKAAWLWASASGEQSYLEIRVDDRPSRLVKLSPQLQKIPLFADEIAGDHTVSVLHNGETWLGQVSLKGISLDDGELLSPPPLPERKLLVLGDSVSCGEALLRESGCRKNSLWWRPGLSYGWLLGEELNAQVHLVCYGGRGLVRSWNGKTDDLNLPDYLELAIADPDQRPAWDHNHFQPQVIVSAIGTNDFSQGIPPRDQYVASYVQLIKRLRQLHPQAQILLTEGAIVNGEHKAALQEYLNQVVRKAEDTKVSFTASNHYPGDNCDAHPTADQHRQMADDLKPVVEALFN